MQPRLAGIHQPRLRPVVPVPGLALAPGGLRVEQGVTLLGHSHLQDRLRGVDVPVGERHRQQLVDSTHRGRAKQMIARVRLCVVIRGDLKMAAGLEVDISHLDPAPAQGLPAPAARPDGADEL